MLHRQYNIPTLKTKVIRFAYKEEQVKQLLLLYKRIIQPYASFLWL